MTITLILNKNVIDDEKVNVELLHFIDGLLWVRRLTNRETYIIKKEDVASILLGDNIFEIQQPSVSNGLFCYYARFKGVIENFPTAALIFAESLSQAKELLLKELNSRNFQQDEGILITPWNPDKPSVEILCDGDY